MMHFIRPFWLFTLIPALLYLTWVIYSRHQNNPWKSVCDPHLLPALLQSGAEKSRRYFNIVLCLFFIICILALAGPAWKKAPLPIYKDISSLMLVLDVSAAMQGTDLTPDRLTRAKFKIRDLIKSAQNTQMGLAVFTAEAFVASPLSQDANTLDAMLDDIYPQMMPIPGSDSGEGLTQGLTLLKQANADHSNILLITASEPTANTLSVAKSIAEAGYHLNVLAMLESSAANQATITKLQHTAELGDGTFYLFSPDSTDIQNILTKNNTKQSIKDDKVENAYLWQDAGPWLCLLLIPLALIVLREKVRHE
ncbi:MAG: VWA domain-containing protein [Pseudomonadota bacterium]